MSGKALGVVFGALVLLSCAETLAPLSAPDSPANLVARAVSVRSVRLSWTPVDDEDVASYRIERRVNHDGTFRPLPTVLQALPTPQMIFIDTEVEPETFYGYRIVAVSRFGDQSRPSIVSGTRTPPPPGIAVSTHSNAPVPEAADPDGYRLTMVGPDTVRATLGLAAQQRFAPLKTGTYTVMLRGIVDRCEAATDSTRTVVVPDTGTHTIAHVDFTINCRDPQRSRVVAMVTATGDSLDASGYELQLTGVATDGNLPDSLRLISQRFLIPAAAGGSAMFDNLRPGEYEIELREVASHCVREGAATRTLTGTAGSTDTVRFRLTCESQRPDDSARPFAWRNTFTPASAAPQSRVFLDVALDAIADSAVKIGALQGEIRYDPALLRYEGGQQHPSGGLSPVPNEVSPGFVALTAVDNNGVGITGVVPVTRLEFTVIGAVGQSAATRTRVIEVSDADVVLFTDSTRAVEDTLAIATGAPLKQPPIANANGPYAAVQGNAIAFSAAGSSDPDGGPLTYRWAFGDGSESTDAAPSKTYATANTYTVTLTVTDDESVTASATTTATVTTDAPDPAKPFTWRATWSQATVQPQGAVSLVITLDASARPQARIAATTFDLQYDPALLRYESTQAAPTNALDGLTANGNTAGRVSIAAIHNAGTGFAGVVGIARLNFTAIGAAGTSATTTSVITDVSDANLAAYGDSIRIIEGTVAIGSGGGTKLSPVANANGPYSAIAGTPITFNAAGSNDPDGGSVTYHWSFGDGSPDATVASPSKSYSTPGTYTATLTVTDDENVIATATATVTVTAPGPAQPLIWRYTFSAVQANNEIVMEVLYDLNADLPETPAPEALASVAVDSLKWNPAMLTFMSLTRGPGAGGSTNSTFAPSGKLSFTVSPPNGINSGLVLVATIRFRIAGATGQSSATQTWIGSSRNAANYNYLPKTQIQEGTFTVP